MQWISSTILSISTKEKNRYAEAETESALLDT